MVAFTAPQTCHVVRHGTAVPLCTASRHPSAINRAIVQQGHREFARPAANTESPLTSNAERFITEVQLLEDDKNTAALTLELQQMEQAVRTSGLSAVLHLCHTGGRPASTHRRLLPHDLCWRGGQNRRHASTDHL